MKIATLVFLVGSVLAIRLEENGPGRNHRHHRPHRVEVDEPELLDIEENRRHRPHRPHRVEIEEPEMLEIEEDGPNHRHHKPHRPHRVKAEKMGSALAKMTVKTFLEHDCEEEAEELVRWFVEEVHSDDGLTWDELHAKITEVAAEHDVDVPEDVWAQIKEWFDSIDTNGDNSITPNELEAAMAAA